MSLWNRQRSGCVRVVPVKKISQIISRPYPASDVLFAVARGHWLTDFGHVFDSFNLLLLQVVVSVTQINQSCFGEDEKWQIPASPLPDSRAFLK